MNALQRQYLIAAYNSAMQDPFRTFQNHDIANELDLDINVSDRVNQAAGIAEDLISMGLIEDARPSPRGVSRTDGPLRLTKAGIEEAQRLTDPIEQRKELRRGLLRAIYDLANGSPTEVVYWRDLAPKFGFADTEEPPSPIMAALDQLGGLSFITIEVDEGTVYRITTAGINEVVDSLPAGDRLPDFVSGSSPKSVSLPFIDSTPDEFSSASPVGEAPVEIQDSLDRFRRDHPNPDKVAFIMMQFGQTRAHAEITEAVRDGLAAYGIAAVRADGKRYHDYLFYNVLTYLHGCGLGIAIYERIETQTYNPNVALEVGYLFAMRKPVCLLKDQTLDTLPADLVGQLYDPFDTQDPAGTIPAVVSKWISDKGLA